MKDLKLGTAKLFLSSPWTVSGGAWIQYTLTSFTWLYDMFGNCRGWIHSLAIKKTLSLFHLLLHCLPLSKKNVQKLYKMYTKIIQNTGFVYIYIVYKNCTNQNFVWYWMFKKCRSNSFTKKCRNSTKLCKVQTENSLKLEMYDFCTYKRCTNYTKPIQLGNWNCLITFFVHTNNVQIIQNLYN